MTILHPFHSFSLGLSLILSVYSIVAMTYATGRCTSCESSLRQQLRYGGTGVGVCRGSKGYTHTPPLSFPPLLLSLRFDERYSAKESPPVSKPCTSQVCVNAGVDTS